MNCYNCGKELKKGDRTTEHIPAKALFAGYGSEYKVQRLTVPACHKCNGEYSKIDDELRNAIGIMNDDVNDDSAKELTRKSVRSIRNKKGWQKRLFLNRNGKVGGVQFNYEHFRSIVIKDFRGIFFGEFGFPLPSTWHVEIISEFDEDKKKTDAGIDIFRYLDKDIGWEKSGHEDIFKYKFKSMASNKDGIIYDSDDLDEADNIGCVQIYHNELGFVVLATKKKFLNANFRLKQLRTRRKKGIR